MFHAVYWRQSRGRLLYLRWRRGFSSTFRDNFKSCTTDADLLKGSYISILPLIVGSNTLFTAALQVLSIYSNNFGLCYPTNFNMSLSNTTATLENGLPQINRYITDHNASGKAVVSKALSEEAQWSSVGVANFFLGYTTRTFPVSLATSGPEGSVPDDVKSYTNDMQVPMGLSVPNGQYNLPRISWQMREQ